MFTSGCIMIQKITFVFTIATPMAHMWEDYHHKKSINHLEHSSLFILRVRNDIDTKNKHEIVHRSNRLDFDTPQCFIATFRRTLHHVLIYSINHLCAQFSIRMDGNERNPNYQVIRRASLIRDHRKIEVDHLNYLKLWEHILGTQSSVIVGSDEKATDFLINEDLSIEFLAEMKSEKEKLVKQFSKPTKPRIVGVIVS